MNTNCGHPWHDNPALIFPCPECGAGGEPMPTPTETPAPSKPELHRALTLASFHFGHYRSAMQTMQRMLNLPDGADAFNAACEALGLNNAPLEHTPACPTCGAATARLAASEPASLSEDDPSLSVRQIERLWSAREYRRLGGMFGLPDADALAAAALAMGHLLRTGQWNTPLRRRLHSAVAAAYVTASESAPLSPAELAGIRERAEKATPGPWIVVNGDDEYCSSICGILSEPEKQRVELTHSGRGDFPQDTRWIVVDPGVAPVQLADDDNEDFIAHARTDVPRLLATVDALAARSSPAPAPAREGVGTLADAAEFAEHALGEVVTGVNAELERGYVLTYEPNAGVAWRHRWNMIASKAEDAKARIAAALAAVESGDIQE